MINKLPEGSLISDFSFAENVLRISRMCEQETEGRELKEPKYYLDKFYEIAERLKGDINKGRNAEEVILKFIKNKFEGLDSKQNPISEQDYSETYKGSFLTNFIDFGRINCISATSLFVSLAEIMDYKLYENCYLGNLEGHSIIRLKSGEDYKNIDEGYIIPDELYLKEWGKIPKTLPKKAIPIVINFNKVTDMGYKAICKMPFGSDKSLAKARCLFYDSLELADKSLKHYSFEPLKRNRNAQKLNLGELNKLIQKLEEIKPPEHNIIIRKLFMGYSYLFEHDTYKFFKEDRYSLKNVYTA